MLHTILYNHVYNRLLLIIYIVLEQRKICIELEYTVKCVYIRTYLETMQSDDQNIYNFLYLQYLSIIFDYIYIHIGYILNMQSFSIRKAYINITHTH